MYLDVSARRVPTHLTIQQTVDGSDTTNVSLMIYLCASSVTNGNTSRPPGVTCLTVHIFCTPVVYFCVSSVSVLRKYWPAAAAVLTLWLAR